MLHPKLSSVSCNLSFQHVHVHEVHGRSLEPAWPPFGALTVRMEFGDPKSEPPKVFLPKVSKRQKTPVRLPT